MELDKLLVEAPLCCPYRDEYDASKECAPIITLPTDPPSPESTNAPTTETATAPSTSENGGGDGEGDGEDEDEGGDGEGKDGDESGTMSRSIIMALGTGLLALFCISF